MSLRHVFALVAALLVLSSAAFAQAPQPPSTTRVVSGTVVDAGTRTAIAGARVRAGEAETSTDPQGRFELRVPPGDARVTATANGYFGLTTTLDVRISDAPETELALASETPFATSVEVAASPTAEPSTAAVQPAQVMRTPGALDNIFRTLQTLPGVAATEEFSSRLAVRGGSPDQNLTMMDGVEIHDPFRLFGLTSAFNPEIIQRFELATGGFSVKYGDRLSSLLLVENRDGRRDRRLAGSAALSITDGNIVLEGGLPGGASGSWLVTGRRTYYDVIAAKVTGQDFPGFADLQAKGVWEPAPGRKVTLFGLRSRQAAAFDIDDGSTQGEFQDDTDNDLAWLRLDSSLGSRGQSHTVVGFSRTSSRFGVDASLENTSQRSNSPSSDAIDIASFAFERALVIEDTSLRQELGWAFGNHLVETGLEAHRLSTSLNFDITGDRNPNAVNGSSQQGGAGLPDTLRSSRQSSRVGTWLQDTWQFGARGSLQAGVRVDRAGVTPETHFSPRISGLLNLAPRTRLKAAVGRYTQSPGYEKSAQSDYVLDLTSPAARTITAERALQGSVGLERDMPGGVLMRAEGYYKRFTDALVGRLETPEELAARVGRYDFPTALASNVPTDPIITSVPTNDGRGRAYGFDVFVSRTSAPVSSKLTGWASYTWGKAEREAYGLLYPFEYDRRHAFTAVTSYRLNPRWELAATTRVATGFPRTAPLGLRVAGEEDRTDADGDGVTDELLPARDANGLLVYAVNFGSVANLNRGRLPVFARVDIRATWRPGGYTGRWELYVEAINALNRKNAGTLDPRLEYDPSSDRPQIVEKRDQSIPLLPTVGLRVRF